MNEAYLASSWASGDNVCWPVAELEIGEIQDHRRRQDGDDDRLVAVLVPEMLGRDRQHGDAQEEQHERRDAPDGQV